MVKPLSIGLFVGAIVFAILGYGLVALILAALGVLFLFV